MKKIEKDDYTVFIFSDGSVRIQARGEDICLGLSDIRSLLSAIRQMSASAGPVPGGRYRFVHPYLPARMGRSRKSGWLRRPSRRRT
jgi:hypothetical protein